MARTHLPDRRLNETHKIHYNGQTFFVTIGYDGNGVAREVFASTNKTGTEMDNLTADACVAISLVLQHDHDPHRLLASMGNVPDLAGEEGATKPASILGAIVQLVADNQNYWNRPSGG